MRVGCRGLQSEVQGTRRADDEQWRKVELLHKHGFWFQSVYDKTGRHDASTLGSLVPDPAVRNVRAMLRIMSVASRKGEPGHIRTIGLWRLGLPELYVPDIPDPYLDDTAELVRAIAQSLIQNDGVSRRGIIEVNLSKLPASWPRNTAGHREVHVDGPVDGEVVEICLSLPQIAAWGAPQARGGTWIAVLFRASHWSNVSSSGFSVRVYATSRERR